jgi:8-hydroxy-5-deazaflavin:NADPH oxidoreductase
MIRGRTPSVKIGILGSGPVGRALGAGLMGHGHEIMLGTRDVAALEEWAADHPDARVGSVTDAARHGEVVVLAVKGHAAAEVLRAAGPEHLRGKPIIDTTNPIADAPAEHGVIRFFTDLNESLMERLQAEFPDLRLVKAFNSVGNPQMVDPVFAGGPPTMFICGNDEDAKQVVREVLVDVGWDVADMGRVEAARAIEPLCILWCIPGLRDNQWNHAFKLLR